MRLQTTMVLLAFMLIAAHALNIKPGVTVDEYEEVHPVLVNEKRDVIAKNVDTRLPDKQRSPTAHFLHRREADILVEAYGQSYHLKLTLNEDLISPNFQVIDYYGEGNMTVKEGIEHCWYLGYVETEELDIHNEVALSTCHGGLDAMIKYGSETIFIYPVIRQDSGTREGGYHVIYRKEHVLEKVLGKCGVTEEMEHRARRNLGLPELDELEAQHKAAHVHNHTADEHQIKFPYKLSKRGKMEARGTGPIMYNRVYYVNDYQRLEVYANATPPLTAAQVVTSAVTLANIVGSRYQGGAWTTANMIIHLVGVVNILQPTFQTSVPGFGASAVVDPTSLLSEFCAWRTTQSTTAANSGTYLYAGQNTNAHLLSGRPFHSGSSGTIGLAYIGTICSSDADACGIQEAWQGDDDHNADTMAHEMGHNFSMQHDSTGNSCASSGNIMQAVICSNCPATTTFSTCSVTYFDTYIPTLASLPASSSFAAGNCLLVTPTVNFPANASNCGNFVVDSGEQCDDGLEGGPCCTTSCQFVSGAVCDSLINSCCSSTCKWLQVGTLCHNSTGSCDNNEYCATNPSVSGALQCPTPSQKTDGTSCGTGSVCSAGACVSRATGCASINNYQLSDSSGTSVSGPYTSCDSTKCTLFCQGSTGSCIDLSVYTGLPVLDVYSGISCSAGCSSGVGTCDGNGNCVCSSTTTPTTPAPTTPAPTTSKAPTNTPTTPAPTTSKAPTTPPPTTPAPTASTCTAAFCNNHGTCAVLNGVNTCNCNTNWRTVNASQPCAAPQLPAGCDGVPGSGKVVDACGVCGGTGAECAGCDGVPNSGKTYDACGVCGGNGKSCAGCDGVPNSKKTYDLCGVCGGTNACVGCDGVPFSNKSYDVCGVCGGNGQSCLGCDGVPNSGKKVDVCGVCGGSGTTCLGCDGVPNSGKIVDQCGVCGGNGLSCLGCDGVPFSGKKVDVCGICGGNGTTCLGCDGVANSGKTYDACGVCGGSGNTCAGCDGVANSGKAYDKCGVCGGNNACVGCDGVPNSHLVYDVCGICGGNNATCVGCDGVKNSGKTKDACGVCGGNNTECAGCDGRPNSGLVFDICHVCGGNNQSCVGCDGVLYSGKVYDVCGVCGGNGQSCVGCDGVVNSGKKYDACGVCGGNNRTCAGCDGVPNSGKKVDVCGVCGGSGTSCLGCNGVPNSGLVFDFCGVCGGNGTTCSGALCSNNCTCSGKQYDRCGVCAGTNACVGCDGVPNSGKVIDQCGVCGGNGLSCVGCDGVKNSGVTYDACGVCGGDGSTCKGCDGVINSHKVVDGCGVCGGNNSTCAGCDGVPNSGKVIDYCGLCGGNGATCGAFQPIPDVHFIITVYSQTDASQYNFTVTGISFDAIVYYTTDGTSPNPLTSLVYTKPVILSIDQFLPATTPTPSPQRRRDSGSSSGTVSTQTVSVVIQAQAFPPPTSERLYKSFITTQTITFSRTSTQAPISNGGVTSLGAGIIAGAVIGGVLGLALLIGLIWFAIVAYRARKIEKGGRQKYRVIYAYQPQNDDEIELRENDIIAVREVFGDGWASGYNERSRKTGAFPMDYVVEVDASRLMLIDRPQTVYGRISKTFGFGGNGELDPSKLPPKPNALPPKPAIKVSNNASRNPLFNAP